MALSACASGDEMDADWENSDEEGSKGQEGTGERYDVKYSKYLKRTIGFSHYFCDKQLTGPLGGLFPRSLIEAILYKHLLLRRPPGHGGSTNYRAAARRRPTLSIVRFGNINSV
ncbi:hypothetical protein EVAR_96123_1 [Eumeta japonica]|uniref:Uncharacterized protein n=1 Tax=Eumeta variegata TaxID=151549 RepID=A0A4C1VDJ0_EUMVA|nr:hypothetical protein EVAR_96123_1 [Eumeta japonica]